ncbi:hypothetical protein [Companilactobacillus ginsenosidimutans]|uniref:DUF1659 domain-containing protein n=1 Tax=Companilactobacillus ginsenosidimutans TaxID=1007676 RepID=A0A0H4QKK9_9LACO|nr:hypothetical protein [Companilactobacillus ginsenosidimutans]AKP67253.1 hypothetical protein ABM34_06670 [Companilactobacillus ginsenosidimutans]
MDWEKTSLKVEFINEKNYKNGKMTRTFNNIVPNPTSEQIELFIEGILLLTKGDTLGNTEILTHNKYISK